MSDDAPDHEVDDTAGSGRDDAAGSGGEDAADSGGEDTRLFRYRCCSCGTEDYVGVDDGFIPQTVRRRCSREFRRNHDRGLKRFVLAGAAGF